MLYVQNTPEYLCRLLKIFERGGWLRQTSFYTLWFGAIKMKKKVKINFVFSPHRKTKAINEKQNGIYWFRYSMNWRVNISSKVIQLHGQILARNCDIKNIKGYTITPQWPRKIYSSICL